MIGAQEEFATPSTPRKVDCGLRRHRHLTARSLQRASLMRLQDDRGGNEASLLREGFRLLSTDFFDDLRAVFR